MGRVVNEIDEILRREARQDRAFRSRRPSILQIRCERCDALVGNVCPSDEGLVLVLRSSFGPPTSQRMATTARLKATARRGASEMIIELLGDRAEGRTFRHFCSHDTRPIAWEHIDEQIANGKKLARI